MPLDINKNEETIMIKIIETKIITNMSDMFSGCSSLLSISNISNWKANYVTDMNHMFYKCSSLLSLPDISIWNTSNVFDMSYMFSGCSSLLSIPDIQIGIQAML